MDTIYIIIITLILGLVIIFFGTTYYEDIIKGFQSEGTVVIFYYWLIALTIFTIIVFSFNLVFYIQLRERKGPRGPKGEQGYTGYLYVK